jgi:hypothetical protein
MRHRLAAVRELREEAGVAIGVDALTPFAHWVTPETEVKRYDTWFFMAVMPDSQATVHDGAEITDSMWVDPADALALNATGAIALPPPTWVTLKTLAAFRDVDAVLQWARATVIQRIQPDVEEHEGVRTFTTPSVRFVLENGRWKPSA